MLALLNWVFQDPVHFIGTLILASTLADALAKIVSAFRPKQKTPDRTHEI